MRRLLCLIPLVFLASGCTTPLATPSGNPEVTIERPVERIKTLVVQAALAAGDQIVADSTYSLTIEHAVPPGQEAAMKIIAGTLLGVQAMGYSTPVNHVTFNFAPIGPKTTKVYCFGSINMTGAFGQPMNTDVTHSQGQATQAMLLRLKARAESQSA